VNKSIFVAAIACGCALLVHAEQVRNWSVGGVSSSTPTAKNGTWVSPSTGVSTNSSSFSLDLGYDEMLAFSPTAAAAPDTGVVTRVVSVVKFVPNTGKLPDFDAPAPRTALTISNDVFCAYVNGIWVPLAGADVPGVEDEVVVLSEVDYRRSTPCVRFGIITGSGSTTNYLHAVGASSGSWLDPSGTTPDPALVVNVSFGGAGELMSVRGDVQLGLFGVGGTKYGTSGEAVTNALEAQNHTITVLRDNNETITIPSDATEKVTVNSNGKSCGGVDNKSSVAMDVNVSIPDAMVAQGNGSYTNDVSVSGSVNLAVSTPDKTKEATGQLIEGNTKLEVTVRTLDTVIQGKLSVADQTLTVNEGLREYLTKYSGKTEGTYNGPHSSHSTIQGELNAMPSGATRTMGQSYALGLAPTEAIVLQPAAADTNATAVMLNMPNVKPNGDFSVTYQVQSNGTTWVDVGSPTLVPQIPVGTGRFRVNTVIAPASAK